MLETNNLSVVMVEPTSLQTRAMGQMLRAAGVQRLDCFRSAEEALAHIRRGVCPDLVISAMHLPGLTGKDLILELRADKATHEVSFLLVSSETQYNYLEPVRQAGVVGILPKPFNLEELKCALQTTSDILNPSDEEEAIGFDELRVLVVDDSRACRHMISRTLEGMGIVDIDHAENGLEATKMLTDNLYDLAVVDYNMPEMDGRELVEYIRTESGQASLPVIMVTSEQDEARLAAVRRSGVSALCDKPFAAATVKEILRRILEEG